MQKRIIAATPPNAAPAEDEWMALENIAEVEVTSEAAEHPIEAALLAGHDQGWRAAGPGVQVIRILFAEPTMLRRIRLCFVDVGSERTQEYAVCWSPDGGRSFRQIVRQQWNFGPGATAETEDHYVELQSVTALEITIVPDMSRGPAIASLAQLRMA
jgi:hypothetical protein